ncbi:MAG: hypothetical protein GX619_02640, partial [Bacteroidales bacterium]|nr:hypothetical protein [Bacteroidales bacterium]
MRKTLTTSLCLLAISLLNPLWAKSVNTPLKQDYPINPVSFVAVKATDQFWAPRIRINQDITIPIALGHCYNTGRVDN